MAYLSVILVGPVMVFTAGSRRASRLDGGNSCSFLFLLTTFLRRELLFRALPP